MSGTRDQVMRLLEESGALKRGHFILSSGRHSDRYCQCAALLEHPAAGERVAALMAQRLRESGVEADIVLAPALGGVLWGYELARALGTRSMFAERGADGCFELRRGFDLPDRSRVILAEDVVTTGGSVMELAPLVENAGAKVVALATIVDRSRGAFKPEIAPLVSLVELEFETWEADALPDHLRGTPAVKPGSRKESSLTHDGAQARRASIQGAGRRT